MLPETRQVKLSTIKFDQSYYPRKEHDPALVLRYAACMDEIEARSRFISVSERMNLLDGRHRQLAYLYNSKGIDTEITVYVYPVTTYEDEFTLAVQLNSDAGWQLTENDKRRCAIDLYNKFHKPIQEIAKILSTRKQNVLDWTKNVREEEEQRQNETIFEMWLSCHTQEEINTTTNVPLGTLKDKIAGEWLEKFRGTKATKHANYEEDDFTPPLYNVWNFAKKTNEVQHFGNSEQRILDNLLYLYTQPFDIVLDPFAGGGSTIDVCKRRLRRYWVSDRKPTEARRDIRTLDIAQELPALHNRWNEVALTYLDPPYWKQAEGQYSTDPQDFANMPLVEFTAKLANVVKQIADKQSHGVIALLLQPTQWKADNRQFTDHVFDICQAIKSNKLTLENRVSCPYNTEQYNPQQVNWAKENHKLLVLTRELIIWGIND